MTKVMHTYYITEPYTWSNMLLDLTRYITYKYGCKYPRISELTQIPFPARFLLTAMSVLFGHPQSLVLWVINIWVKRVMRAKCDWLGWCLATLETLSPSHAVWFKQEVKQDSSTPGASVPIKPFFCLHPYKTCSLCIFNSRLCLHPYLIHFIQF